MALYTNLPVFKASYDLLIALFKTSRNFAREYRFTLGESIKKEAVEMVKLIYRANKTADKAPHLETARETLEIVRLELRLLKDLKQVNLKQFVYLNEQIESVSKQLAAWHNSTNNVKI